MLVILGGSLNSSRYYQIQNFYPLLKHPEKYKGTLPITLRSGLEIKFAEWCDNNGNVLEWASESIVVPYISPVDNKWHRYFVDFNFKSKTKDGNIKEFLVEVKPSSQVKLREPKKKTKHFLKEIQTYAVNQAKWEYARKYCSSKDSEFVIITEKDLP